jgi:hypothetical protein
MSIVNPESLEIQWNEDFLYYFAIKWFKLKSKWNLQVYQNGKTKNKQGRGSMGSDTKCKTKFIDHEFLITNEQQDQ